MVLEKKLFNFIIYDIEIYPNYFLVVFKTDTGETYEWSSELGVDDIKDPIEWIENKEKENYIFVGWNNLNYDRFILQKFIQNYKKLEITELVKTLKNLSNQLINDPTYSKMPSFKKEQELGLKNKRVDYDLMINTARPNPLGGNFYTSLKEMGVRINHPILETLPFDPEKLLSKEQKTKLREYCYNDVEITYSLFKEFYKDKVKSKSLLIKKFKMPLNSFAWKEGTLVQNILVKTPKKELKKVKIKEYFQYFPLAKFDFKTQILKDVLNTYTANTISSKKDVIFKDAINMFDLDVKFGVGGLHAAKPNYEGENLIELDVASFYPYIMKNYNLLPTQVENKKLYYEMIDNRIETKKNDPDLADAQKVVLNTVFGQLGFKNSKLYNFSGMYNVTITGQLLIMKLVEMFYLKGYEIVYINTDGIIFKDKGTDEYLKIKEEWEKQFNFNLEESRIKKIYLRDVNNYILIDDKNKIKKRGAFVYELGKKNYAYHRIVWKAIENYLIHNIPIENTIYDNNNNIYDYLMYHKFSKRSFELTYVIDHKTQKKYQFKEYIRYYLSSTQNNQVWAYGKNYPNGRRVELSNNVFPIFNVKNTELPSDLDYKRYIKQTYLKLKQTLNKDISPLKLEKTPLIKAGINENWLVGGIGKYQLGADWINNDIETWNVKCGVESGYLALDVDDPNSVGATALLKLITKDHFIVFDSKYTIDDVFARKCRFKVIFKFDGEHIPKSRANKAIEVFYTKRGQNVAIFGKKEGTTSYKISGEVKELTFDINMVLERKVAFSLINKDDSSNKIIEQEETLDLYEPTGNREVNIVEFKRLLMLIDKRIADNIIIQKKGKMLIFDCPNENHSGKNFARAYNNDGIYYVSCFGNVCIDDWKDINKELRIKGSVDSYLKKTKGFPIEKREKLNIFKAHMGWGKTFRITEEMARALNNNSYLLILVPNKANIDNLINMFESNHDKKIAPFIQSGKIAIYTANNENEKRKKTLMNANVIISHHQYFQNVGDMLSFYETSYEILNKPNQALIIDEADAFVEKISTLNILTSYKYKKGMFKKGEVWKKDNEKYTSETFFEKIKNREIDVLDKTQELIMGMTGEIKLICKDEVIDILADEYIGLIPLILKNKDFKMEVKDFKKDNYLISVIANENKYNMMPHNVIEKINIEDQDEFITNNLIKRASRIVIWKNKGDEFLRKNVGDVNVSFYFYELLDKLLSLPREIILTSATFENYHFDIIGNITNKYNFVEKKEPMEKIKKILVLRNAKNGGGKNKTLEKVSEYKMNSLFFLSTKNDCDVVLRGNYRSKLWWNDNGITKVAFNRNENYTEKDRNISLVSLEAPIARGYNFIEEISKKENGFELIWFQQPPISPDFIKCFINKDGKLIDRSFDNNLNKVIQAIGRAFRKEKDRLTICLNAFPDDIYNSVIKQLRNDTGAEVIEGKLNVANLEIAISKLTEKGIAKLKNNELVQKIYGGNHD